MIVEGNPKLRNMFFMFDLTSVIKSRLAGVFPLPSWGRRGVAQLGLSCERHPPSPQPPQAGEEISMPIR